MTTIGRVAGVVSLGLALGLVACGDDTSPGGDLGHKIDQKVSTADSGAQDSAGGDSSVKKDVGAQADLSASHDSQAGADAAPSCTTCHGTPPTTGAHVRHVSKVGLTCSNCHAEVVDSAMTIINPTLHKNGQKNVASDGTKTKFTWTGTSCTNNSGCHGTRGW